MPQKKKTPAHRLELAALRIAIAELEDLRELLEGLEPSTDPSSLVRAARLAVEADLREAGIAAPVARRIRELVARTVKVAAVGEVGSSLVSFTAWESPTAVLPAASEEVSS